MLPIQVALCALTGRAEMSVLKTLSAGKSEQLVPGSGWADTLGAKDEARPTTSITVRPQRRIRQAIVFDNDPSC
jgi:hypothetical protein